MRIAAAGINGSTERALTSNLRTRKCEKCRAPTRAEGPESASRRRQTSDTARASTEIPPATNNANASREIPVVPRKRDSILNTQAVAAAPRPAAMQLPRMNFRRQNQGMKSALATATSKKARPIGAGAPERHGMVRAKLIFRRRRTSSARAYRGGPPPTSAEDRDWNQQIERPTPKPFFFQIE